MINKLTKIVMALLSAILFISNIEVFALESSWNTNGIIYPLEGDLVPAGPVEVQWESLDEASYYEIYLDDDFICQSDTNSYELYCTDVDKHSIYIKAILDEGYEITDEREFYISKKGLAYSYPEQVQNVGASWYYNWGISSNVTTDLDFVPMVWGSGNESSNITKILNSGYDTVLSYNEPEGSLSGQSNVDVSTAIKYFDYFKDSGLRIGSPAVEHIGTLLEDDSWFDQYASGIDLEELDFIAVHEYFYSVCTCSDEENAKNVAKNFLQQLQQVYDKYHKPIWITEMGVVNYDSYWLHYSNTSTQGKQEVYEFLEYVINGVDDLKGLNELEYVERYAWFPFDTTSTTAGASSLFITDSDYKSNSSYVLGKLNDLGKLYRDIGNPNDYIIVNDISYCTLSASNVKYDGSEKETNVNVVFEGNVLTENIDYIVEYSNNINVGEAQALVKGIGNYTGEQTISFKITAKDIGNLEFVDIENQKCTGKAIEPDIVIKDGDKKLVLGEDYQVYYDNNVNIGTASVKVIGQGNYQGTVRLSFEIVENPIMNISLDKNEIILNKGESSTLTATITPSDTTDDKTLSWTSSDTSVVTVSNGTVTAVAPGRATVTVKTSNGKTASCTVTVLSPITGVTLDKTVLTLNKGDSSTLTATITPSDTTDDKTLSWTSSDTSVVTVSNGTVPAVAPGNAMITVKTSNAKTASCTVTVLSPITSITLNKTSLTLNKGNSYTLTATINPNDTTDSKALTWKSSNSKVVSVSSKGVIKALTNGKATITVTSVNGKSATCSVTVPYTIKYVLNGGTNNASNPSSYYGKKITLKNPKRKGYIFVGWYTSSSYKTKITSFSSGNKTLYAKWQKVSVSKAKTPTLTNLKGKKLKISYGATSGAKGYVIQVATNKKFTTGLKQYTTTSKSKTLTLIKGKTYYVRVRAYKYDSMGNKVYGKWSTVKYKKITK